MEIGAKTVVSLRYVMKNDDGEVIENRMSGALVTYIHGSGKILPELESQLTGLKKGDQKTIAIEQPGKFYFDLEIADVREAKMEEWATGEPMIFDCGPDCCC